MQKAPKDLEGITPGELLRDITQHVKEEVFEGQENRRVDFEVQMKAFPKFVRFDCTGKIEGMRVPISILFHYLQDERLIPKKETFPRGRGILLLFSAGKYSGGEISGNCYEIGTDSKSESLL